MLQIINLSDKDYIYENISKNLLNNFAVEMKCEILKLGNEIFGDDFPEFIKYKADKNKNKKKMINKPGRSWYPRFLICKEKYNHLKAIKGKEIGGRLLKHIADPFEELLRYSEYSESRHSHNVKQGWWPKKQNL